MTTPLFAEIRDEIVETGPIGIARYMALCLGHPVHGYYRSRDPLGARGDFVTAPEISQMFGELIGIWIALTWAAMGGPSHLVLAELGPGRGTLMADALRALNRAAPDWKPAIHLVETSPVLRAAQASRLGAVSPTWHDGIETLPDGPMIVIANEFFDALPVRQFLRTERGWCERLVGLSPDGGRLAFGLAAEPDREIAVQAPVGALMTVPGAALDIVRSLSRRIVAQGGALLAIDYGHVRPGFGDTLQAVSAHRFTDPLLAPGEADLTTHVDFAALGRAAIGEGARVDGPLDQRGFLLNLGLRERADRLKGMASQAQAEAVDAAFHRLTASEKRGMGSLFQAIGIADPRLAALSGFASA
ncbi:class I SAM-dependent methyltransferase [Methylobacterium sp. Leaf106]|uniref:class I SAM-dependent methyltransferase n=1 Tax=Methylobacterium sp. Leaf106 TaxID=1736255 RepID=UPI0007023B88|nr:SAM-dependent methyltransferase [Methylobacterium sp. Leaf106]KQP53481.1 ATP synthase subunit beta [Methylobacterium sp. Leaf106]